MRNCTDLIKALGTRSERLKWATNPSGMIRWLAEIQIEAWREGMLDASKIAIEAPAKEVSKAIQDKLK